MKRFLIMFMVLGLVFGSVAIAEAAKRAKKPMRVERTVEGSYEAPVLPFDPDRCSQSGGRGCVAIRTGARESFLTAKATDAHGLPVLVQVWASTDQDNIDDVHFGTFCGETTHPISFPPGSELHFWVGFTYSFAPYESCPAGTIATTGTVSVTLSNLAPQTSVPVRSGSILSGTGWVVDGSMGGCQVSPQCAAWLQSDCDPASAGRDPGLTASIVDVGTLADGPSIERTFRFGPDDLWTPVWGGVQLQFWKSDCTEISDARWRSTDCDGDESGRARRCQSTRLRIPPSAKWMTVTGSPDNVNLTWTLS